MTPEAAPPAASFSYCEAASGHPFHGPYHDSEYGFPLREDDALFAREPSTREPPELLA